MKRHLLSVFKDVCSMSRGLALAIFILFTFTHFTLLLVRITAGGSFFNGGISSCSLSGSSVSPFSSGGDVKVDLTGDSMFPSSSTVSSMNGISISSLDVGGFFDLPPRITFSGGGIWSVSFEVDFPNGARNCINKLFRVGYLDERELDVFLVPGLEWLRTTSFEELFRRCLFSSSCFGSKEKYNFKQNMQNTLWSCETFAVTGLFDFLKVPYGKFGPGCSNIWTIVHSTTVSQD